MPSSLRYSTPIDILPELVSNIKVGFSDKLEKLKTFQYDNFSTGCIIGALQVAYRWRAVRSFRF